MRTASIPHSLVLALVALFVAFPCAQSAAAQTSSGSGSADMLVYIGTYALAQEDGIHICRLNLKTGALTRVAGLSGIRNPSFLALHPNGRFLYAASEVTDYRGQQAGSISALAIEPGTGMLKLLNTQSSMGAAPCHVEVDRAGRHVLAANYTGGSVVVLPIKADGQLDMPSAFVQHQGSSINPQRQERPHAHCIVVDAADHHVVSADLGLDKILIYRYDDQRGSITPNPNMPAAVVKPGSGPRHFAFHPKGKFGYVINELSSTVTAFSYDAQRGELQSIQDISTLPPDFRGENSTAEIAVSADGRFLYGSNRGHQSIVVFAIDAGSGKLTYVSHHATLGEMPRNFAIDPSGQFLLAANQRTDNVVVFRLDRQSGRLEPTESSIPVPKPVCVAFLPLE